MTLFSAVFFSIVALHDPVAGDIEQNIQPAPPDECSRSKTAHHSAARAEVESKNIDDPEAFKTDVRHYRIDFEVQPSAQIVNGSTTMTVASRIGNLSTFRFWLNASMAIASIEADGQAVEWRRLDTSTVDVDLNRSYDEGEVFDIEISYRGTPVSTWSFASQGGWPVVWTLSQPWYASEWWPVKEDNRDKATGEMVITVPSELTVVSNGLLVRREYVAGGRRRYHWSTEYPTSPYLFAFSATVYNSFSDTFNYDGGSMPVDFFIYPESDTAANRRSWRLAVDMLSTFEDLFGPYPFREEKYAIYQFPFGGGMEHQTATGQGGDRAFLDYLTAHELAHQWWGDMVTCATWNDIWLNEGFATYSTALWFEHASGTSDPQARHAYMEAARPDEFDGTVWVYDTSDPSRIFSGNYSYQKGAWVLHMLRGVVGDEVFFGTLAAYRQAYEYSTATTENFRAVAEEVWGADLKWFFDSWVFWGGAPGYRYGWQEHEINDRRFLEIYLVQNQNEPVFEMPVEIVTLENGQNRSYTVWNDAREEHILIPVDGEVDDVELDPEDWILRRSRTRRAFVDGPPKVVVIDPSPASSLPIGQPLSMAITFHRDVVIGEGDVVLRRSDGIELGLDIAYSAATHTATLTSSEPLPGGRYQIIVRDTIVDAEDGLALDGEVDKFSDHLLPSGDGQAGGDAVVEFGVIGHRRATGRVVPGH